jgi:hypothetical protein
MSLTVEAKPMPPRDVEGHAAFFLAVLHDISTTSQ